MAAASAPVRPTTTCVTGWAWGSKWGEWDPASCQSAWFQTADSSLRVTAPVQRPTCADRPQCSGPNHVIAANRPSVQTSFPGAFDNIRETPQVPSPNPAKSMSISLSTNLSNHDSTGWSCPAGSAAPKGSSRPTTQVGSLFRAGHGIDGGQRRVNHRCARPEPRGSVPLGFRLAGPAPVLT